MALKIHSTRISPTHHTFAYKVNDGPWTAVENETRSALDHDLIHYALETELGLQRSFFGLLASGKSYAELSNAEDMKPGADQNSEILNTERIVGALSGVMKGAVTPIKAIQGLSNLYQAHGQTTPKWLTEELIAKVQERFSKLKGQWNATAFHSSMELTFKL